MKIIVSFFRIFAAAALLAVAPVAVAEGYPLCFSAANGDMAKVKYLLAKEANLNAMTDNGETALIWVAFHGHAEVANVLLMAGANPNAVNYLGRTALDFAIGNTHI